MSSSGSEATETAQQNGSPSVDGYGSASPAQPDERPEVVLGAAFVGGLLLAGLVSRVGR
jgi:hypothetical protein